MNRLLDGTSASTINKLIALVKAETVSEEGNDDPRWAETHVKTLARRLKKGKYMEELEKAISNEEPLTDCVPMNRDPDAKGHRRGPHVLYTKMWRFPWLRAQHKLKAVKNCRYPYSKESKTFCINPYHYEVIHIPTPALPPIIIDKSRVYPMGDVSIISAIRPEDHAVPNVSINVNEMEMSYRENHPGSYMSESSSPALSQVDSPYGSNGSWSSPSSGTEDQSTSWVHQNSVHSPLYSSGGATSSPESIDLIDLSSTLSPGGMFADQIYNVATMSGPYQEDMHGRLRNLDAISPQSFLSEDEEMEVEPSVRRDDRDRTPTAELMTEAAALPPNGRQQIPDQNAIVRNPRRDMIREIVEYSEPDVWMTMTYYEEIERVGDPFYATTPYVLIDGFTAPNEHKRKPNISNTRDGYGRSIDISEAAHRASMIDRFCLGYMDKVYRPQHVHEARKNIGRGARMYYIGGEVFAECLSKSAIFIQSPNCNQRHGWYPSTVCKVPQRCNLKLFNNAEFAQQLMESVEKGYESVYALTRLCSIRMSFVKGWGCDYRRQIVSATPCWVEAHLNGPLKWIDRVLATMGAPNQVASSFT